MQHKGDELFVICQKERERVDHHHIHIGDKLSHFSCMIVNVLVWQIRNVVKSRMG